MKNSLSFKQRLRQQWLHIGFYTGFSVVGAAMAAVTLVRAILLWGSRDKFTQDID